MEAEARAEELEKCNMSFEKYALEEIPKGSSAGFDSLPILEAANDLLQAR